MGGGGLPGLPVELTWEGIQQGNNSILERMNVAAVPDICNAALMLF